LGNEEVHLNTATVANALATTMTTKETQENKTTLKDSTWPALDKRPSEKVTYKYSEDDIKRMEISMDENSRPLKRQWASFSFYILAGLAIILPILFLGKWLGQKVLNCLTFISSTCCFYRYYE
jgi:hypothetical protein